MTRAAWIVVVVLFVAPPVEAQQTASERTATEPSTEEAAAFCADGGPPRSIDARGLALVYCTESPVVSGMLKGAHATSYPVFYGAVPTAWVGGWVLHDPNDFTDAYRLTLTQLATYGLTLGLKRSVGRPRPFVTLPLTARGGEDPERLGRFESFPSGHASLSVALATSWSLSHPKWYVVVPSVTWAGAVTVSRLYLGVHYPSDVLTGAVLGASVATAVHLLRDSLTPDALRPDRSSGPGITVKIRF